MRNESSQLDTFSPVNGINRLYYLDWLRVITVIAVFFHHCSRIFDIRSLQLYNATTSLTPTIHREFNNLWMMPLLFIVSGAAVYYSLKIRTVGGFIRERLLRILLPLLTIGLFVIVPPQVYLERLINGEFSSNFFKWYHHYFEGFYPHGNFHIAGSHLWYLWFLFTYTLILLVFFIPIGKQKISIFSRFSNLFNKAWGLLLLFIPLIALAPLEIYSNRLAGGWDFFPYLIFFACGYLFFSDERIQESVRKYCIACLVSALVLTIIYLYIEFSNALPAISSYMLTGYKILMFRSFNPPDLSIGLIGFFVLRHLAACCWVIALLGLGSRFLNFNNKFLAYANEAVLPFYILHMTIINSIAYFVNQQRTGITANYIIIAVSSFIAIMIIYELLIRRIKILRFFFGMKLKKSIKTDMN